MDMTKKHCMFVGIFKKKKLVNRYFKRCTFSTKLFKSYSSPCAEGGMAHT